jgi:hypothetical protein
LLRPAQARWEVDRPATKQEQRRIAALLLEMHGVALARIFGGE